MRSAGILQVSVVAILMLGKLRVPRIRLVICCSSLMIAAASAVAAQRRARIPPPTSLLQVLDKDDRQCISTNGGLSKSVSVQSIRLAADRTSQLLIKGSSSCLCGAQNCNFWIYRKKNRKYDLLLTGAGAIKIRAAPHSVASGYRDVVSESHASANETVVRTYRFDGTQYHLARCLTRSYYDDNGNTTRVPVTRPCNSD